MFAHTEGGAKLVGLQYTADNELVEYLNTFVQVIQDIQISRVEQDIQVSRVEQDILIPRVN